MSSSLSTLATTVKSWLPLKHPPSYTAGLTPYRTKQWQAAQQKFEQAIRERPGHAPSHFKLGMCLFRQAMYPQAHECISKALLLAPNEVQWQAQLQQVQRYLIGRNKQSNAAEPTVKDSQSLLAVIQYALLNAEYQKANELGHWVIDLLAGAVQHRATVKKVRYLLCEAALMKGDGSALQAVAMLDEKDVARYIYTAIECQYRGDAHKALNTLQLAGSLVTPPDTAYWQATMLAASGDSRSAWELLENITLTSRRAATWQYLSELVSSPADLQRYLLLLEQWCAKSPTARHHRDVATATAQAALAGGNGILARKVLHDSIEFHQKRKGGPASVLPSALKNSQEPGAPRWIQPFAALPPQAIQQTNTARAHQALAAVMQVAQANGNMPILLQDTLQWAMGEYRHKAPETLVLGIIESENVKQLQAALHQHPCLLLRRNSKQGSDYAHANGVEISLVIISAKEGKHTYQYQHASYTHAELTPVAHQAGDVSVFIPTNLSNYFEESGLSQNEPVVSWLMEASNKSIENQDAYITLAYQAWLCALVYESSELEGIAIRQLRELGEHKQPYQRQLSNYTIPSVSTIKKDGVQIVLYVSGLEKVGYQANMWIPVLEKLSQPAAIVIREKRIAEELIQTRLPIYFMQSMRDVENLEEADVKVVLYPANTQKNIHTLRFHRMQHYFINHGESDKVVNQSKFLMAYDKLLVAGPLAERRLKEADLPLRDGQVVHVGRPQVELLLQQVNQPTTNIQTILYAPTWEGFVEEANYASVSEFGYEMLQQLAKNKALKVLFKPHPYTGYNKSGQCGYYLEKMIALCGQHNNLEYIETSQGIHRYMNQSDMLITDISSVLNEYLYTQKPIVLCNVQGHSQTALEQQFPSSKAAYLLDGGLDVTAVLEEIVRGDEKYEARKLTCDDSLGRFSESYMQRFDNVVTNNCNGV
ncbi:CDP-glycerol glycerophosphotransferase family protein [Halomonas sp. BC2]|uniref:CDP-glycerol glycerophosphotransferase family protein n=1 Tax=Halomonas sp. BC2 TaxID=1670449 RepID=UPI0009BD563C|nr:CDP-glycerol glycerophosphotransferase family protein [Halomonas sp. BC2]